MQLTAFIVSLLWSVFSFSDALWEEEKVIRQKGQKNVAAGESYVHKTLKMALKI